MTNLELKNIASEDIDDLLVKVEASFDIKFDDKELIDISTFGQFCDLVTDKITLNHSNDCTSQQAFYKLREAISMTLQIDKKTIYPATSLKSLFPRPTRRSQIKKIEQQLDVEISILRPPYLLTGTLIVILVASIIGIFFHWLLGLLGLAFSITVLNLVYKMGNELDLQTVGEVTEKIKREHYLKSRRNRKTFNRNEIVQVLTDLFSKELDLEKSKLNRESKFV
jgi:hypothetical protein